MFLESFRYLRRIRYRSSKVIIYPHWVIWGQYLAACAMQLFFSHVLFRAIGLLFRQWNKDAPWLYQWSCTKNMLLLRLETTRDSEWVQATFQYCSVLIWTQLQLSGNLARMKHDRPTQLKIAQKKKGYWKLLRNQNVCESVRNILNACIKDNKEWGSLVV